MRKDSPRIDRELTRLRHEIGDYEHPDSFVNWDGKEYLYGPDKTRRRYEIWERDKRRCAHCGKYVTFEQMEMHHLAKNHGAMRWDNADNLRTLCSECHRGIDGVHP